MGGQWATGSRKEKAAEGKGKGTASAGKQLPVSELQQRLVNMLEKAALELEHKEAKARLEQELIQVQLGAAVSEPTASRKKVGKAAAARLMQQLRSQGQHGQQQRRTKRQCTLVSKQEKFEERRLRQLGAQLIHDTAVA